MRMPGANMPTQHAATPTIELQPARAAITAPRYLADATLSIHGVKLVLKRLAAAASPAVAKDWQQQMELRTVQAQAECGRECSSQQGVRGKVEHGTRHRLDERKARLELVGRDPRVRRLAAVLRACARTPSVNVAATDAAARARQHVRATRLHSHAQQPMRVCEHRVRTAATRTSHPHWSRRTHVGTAAAGLKHTESWRRPPACHGRRRSSLPAPAR
jgi:hypothetical protein